MNWELHQLGPQFYEEWFCEELQSFILLCLLQLVHSSCNIANALLSAVSLNNM